jgi:hypothetical protein
MCQRHTKNFKIERAWTPAPPTWFLETFTNTSAGLAPWPYRSSQRAAPEHLFTAARGKARDLGLRLGALRP